MSKQSYYEKQAKIKQNGYILNGKYILTNTAILPTPEPPVSKIEKGGLNRFKPKFLQ